MLHLHRFHHRDLLALGNGIAFGDSERDDRALQRSRNCDAAVGAGHGRHRYAVERGRARSHGLGPNSIRCGPVGRGVIDVAVVQHGQRIVADRGTSPPAGTGGGRRLGGRPDRCRLGSSGAQRLGVIGHEASGELIAGHLGPVEQRGEEPQVRGHAVDAELAQGPARPADRVGIVTAWAVGDHLGEQRVEAGVRAISHVAVGVSA